MLRFAADENLNNDIIRGLLRRKADLDIIRIQDVGLSGADDSAVLEWSALEGRILLTHDVNTITEYAYQRIKSGKRMPGVLEIRQTLPVKQVIEDILLLVECFEADEWENRILYLPLQ
jgi:predicted nuclease of predicted toxin-antitoxin system